MKVFLGRINAIYVARANVLLRGCIIVQAPPTFGACAWLPIRTPCIPPTGPQGLLHRAAWRVQGRPERGREEFARRHGSSQVRLVSMEGCGGRRADCRKLCGFGAWQSRDGGTMPCRKSRCSPRNLAIKVARFADCPARLPSAAPSNPLPRPQERGPRPAACPRWRRRGDGGEPRPGGAVHRRRRARQRAGRVSRGGRGAGGHPAHPGLQLRRQHHPHHQQAARRPCREGQQLWHQR